MGRLFNESAFFVFDLLLGWRWHERRFKIIMKSGVSFALVRILRVSNSCAVARLCLVTDYLQGILPFYHKSNT